MTLDRLGDGYEPNFDIDYEFGRQGEMFVADIVHALKTGGVEVKTDAQYAKTGNLYVELFQHPRRGKAKPSGLCVTAAELWVFVLPGDGKQMAVVAPVWVLRQLCYEAWENHRWRKSCVRGDNPTDGVAVPLDELIAAVVGRNHPRPQDGVFRTTRRTP